ncbi:hypothetical protein A4R44_06357 [Amycolatopsis sp. M39]|nr:hypothetical protein A4R44_06357 [Amycolatopsis sp. M39]
MPILWHSGKCHGEFLCGSRLDKRLSRYLAKRGRAGNSLRSSVSAGRIAGGQCQLLRYIRPSYLAPGRNTQLGSLDVTIAAEVIDSLFFGVPKGPHCIQARPPSLDQSIHTLSTVQPQNVNAWIAA